MSATDRVYVHAKERILDGRFPEGELITEGDVAAGVGVSRTPVREAFLRLESEGLLRLYPKRGALVVPVSAIEIENVFETRLVIERFALERIIDLELDLHDELSAAIEAQERVATAEQAPAFVAGDREFHRLMVAATGNELLLQFHDSLRDRQSRMGLAALGRGGDQMERILREHRLIVEAIDQRDRERGAAVVADHLGQTVRLLRGPASALGYG